MTTPFDSLAKLSGQELLDHFGALVARDRRTTAELLVAIAEIDERKLWAVHACSSMFTFCMERFHMSEQMTAKRLWAARMARRFPLILGMVARGELHLTAIHLLAHHLTDENHANVLERAKYKSSREIERLVAELAPRADVPFRIRALPSRAACKATDGPATVEGGVAKDRAASNGEPARGKDDLQAADVTADGRSNGAFTTRTTESARKPIAQLSPRRFRIEITVDEATHDKLRSLQDLLGRSETGRDPAAIIGRAIEVLHARTLARKAACTGRPRQAESATSSTLRQSEPDASNRGQRSRHIPAAVRREVWKRDSGRCCFEDAHGRRCSATSNVEFHHRNPFALGGSSTAGNIELRCAAHNQLQADLDFGRSFIDAKRSRVAASPAFRAECGG